MTNHIKVNTLKTLFKKLGITIEVAPKHSTLRIARPTDNLEEVCRMYIEGLGFKLLGEFENHNGFDGKIIGHDHHGWHLEFTHHTGTTVGRAPTQDHLLVFYIPDAAQWRESCNDILAAGFSQVEPYNKYWAVAGATFEDIDGYRVVLQNGTSAV